MKGSKKKTATINNSKIKRNNKNNREKEIKNVLTIIPKTIENKTSPLRYSFFNGLKNVLNRRGTDKTFKMYELRRTKKSIEPRDTSWYQKIIKSNGYKRAVFI